MTATPRPPRLAFLVVEDQAETRASLTDLLRDAYAEEDDEDGDVRVDAAATVADAAACVRAARAAGVRYDVSILDLVLPADADRHPVAQPDLISQVLPATNPAGVVFHITAYPTDPEFYQSFHNRSRCPDGGRRGAASIPFPKADPRDWTGDLLREIAAVVHGDRIEARLHRLFGPPADEPDLPGVCGRVSTAPVDCDPSQELFALADDVERHYNQIHPHLRQKLERVFTISEDVNTKQVQVRLL